MPGCSERAVYTCTRCIILPDGRTCSDRQTGFSSSFCTRCDSVNTLQNYCKKHLKNVGPIRHCEPPHAHSPCVASGTVARRLRIDVYDNNDNEWAQSATTIDGIIVVIIAHATPLDELPFIENEFQQVVQGSSGGSKR